MKLPFVQVDAFARRPFEGNPACVVPLDAWLDDATLQAIAEENNVSETAFLVPDATGETNYELRWFTPTTEVVLCGHATLASGHYLLTRDGRERIAFRTRRSGVLRVERDGPGYRHDLPAWRAEPRPLPAIVAGLGLTQVVETRWHPQRYGLVVVEDANVVLGLQPDFKALAADGDILTIVTAPGRDSDVISRVFAPGGGIDEDPVTGSAHAVLAPYWCARLGRESFSAHQASRRGGRLTCTLAGERVVLSGGCVTVIEGVLTL